MRPRVSRLAALALVSLAASSSAQAAVEIQHTTLTCVPVDRYARVAGRAAAKVARAELQFRTDPAGGWYSVRMVEQGGEWSAFLPRPTSAIRQIEYRIVMTGADASSGATPAVAVPVQEATACDAVARASVESPIVITVPEGAPAIPPVPAGFTPAGVVVAEEKHGLSRGMKIAGGAAAAAVLGATAGAVAGSSSDPVRTDAELPEVRFNGTSPAPGSVLPPTGARLVILMELGPSEATVLSLTWGAALLNSSGRTCLTMGGRVAVSQGPGTPIELTGTLTIPFGAPGTTGCGAQFDTSTLHLTVSNHDVPLYEEALALPFRFQP